MLNRIQSRLDGTQSPAPTPQPLSETDLPSLFRSNWAFGPVDAAPFGTIGFLPNGRTHSYRNENERRWALRDGALVLISRDGVETSVLDRVVRTDRIDEIVGTSLGGDPSSRCLKRVDPLRDYNPADRQLLVESRLGSAGGPLLVVFNSRGNTWSEDAGIRWEYYRAFLDLGIDMLRFAERKLPGCWYLNVADQVRNWLRFAATDRRLVIIAGNSSGGYAAMFFGEFLAAISPECRIETISLNPQTVHSFEHRTGLRMRTPRSQLPPMIEEDVLVRFGSAGPVDLDQVFDEGRPNIRHTIVYDQANPGELYYAEKVSRFGTVETRPLALGMKHAKGIVHMEKQGMLRALVDERLRDFELSTAGAPTRVSRSKAAVQRWWPRSDRSQ